MIKKVIYIISGFLFLGIGIVGIVLHMLPTFPFLVVASYCFMKGSEKINAWFESTKMYRLHLKPFRQQKGMTLKAKLIIIIPVYIVFIALFITKDILPMRVALVVLLTMKTVVFVKMKTIKNDELGVETNL